MSEHRPSLRCEAAVCENEAAPGLFPSSDHFPLGRPYGLVEQAAQHASVRRPFGLTMAIRSPAGARVDPAELGYDDERQIGLIRDRSVMVPLARHTTGQTNTVTDKGDGQNTSVDSDTDYRED